MDPIETLLIIVVIALATLLIVIGVQVLLMVLALRKAIAKLNAILDEPKIFSRLLELFKRRRPESF